MSQQAPNWKRYLRDLEPLDLIDELHLPDFRIPHERRDEIRAAFQAAVEQAGYIEARLTPVMTLRKILADVCKSIDLPREIIRLELKDEYAMIGAIIGSCGHLRMDY